jgi:hypothetical protein
MVSRRGIMRSSFWVHGAIGFVLEILEMLHLSNSIPGKLKTPNVVNGVCYSN